MSPIPLELRLCPPWKRFRRLLFVVAAYGSMFEPSALCAPSNGRTIVGMTGMGGLSLFEICSAPVRLEMSCACGIDACVMGAGGWVVLMTG